MVFWPYINGGIFCCVLSVFEQRLKSNFEELCEEDKILVFFELLLQELEDWREGEKRTGCGKSSVATFKQCTRYLEPPFKMCRKKVHTCKLSLCSVIRGCLWSLLNKILVLASHSPGVLQEYWLFLFSMSSQSGQWLHPGELWVDKVNCEWTWSNIWRRP